MENIGSIDAVLKPICECHPMHSTSNASSGPEQQDWNGLDIRPMALSNLQQHKI